MPPSTPPPPTSPATVKSSHVVGYCAVAGCIALVLIVGVVYWVKSQPLPHVPVVGAYKSNTKNIQFQVPAGWEESAASTTFPFGYSSSGILLSKVDNPCVISSVASRSHEEKQVTFADRVFSQWGQYDGNWFAASTTESQSITFSEYTRQYLPGEYRFSYNLRHDPFILFTRDGSPVPDSCNTDFNTLLQSLEPYFEPIHLTADSKGTIVANKVWDDRHQGGENNKTFENLLFTDSATGERREIVKLPTGTYVARFEVQGNILYVPGSTGEQIGEGSASAYALYRVDPFSGTIEAVPGTNEPDSYISDLYVRNGTAYYLASSTALGNCVQGSKNCAANLYSVPLNGGPVTLVAHTSIGGSIVGYSDTEQAWYLHQGWGDAGCTSTTFTKVIGGTEESVGKFGGCDPDLEQVKQSVNAVLSKIPGAKINVQAIQVENGMLSPSLATSSGYAMFSFDK